MVHNANLFSGEERPSGYDSPSDSDYDIGKQNSF